MIRTLEHVFTVVINSTWDRLENGGKERGEDIKSYFIANCTYRGRERQ